MIRIPGVQETPPSVVSLQAPSAQQVQQTEGLQMLGQLTGTLASQANRFAAIGRQGLRNARVSKAKEGKARAAQEINRLLEDRETGYLRKQGGAARDGIADFERELDEVQKKLVESFDDEETRKMFEEAAAIDFARAKTAAGIHWSKQSQVANAAQSKVLYNQYADEVASGSWDSRKDLGKEIDEYGQIVGLSPKQREALYKEKLSIAEATFVETLIDEGNLKDAADELEDHGDKIERSVRAKLQKRLRETQKAQAAMSKTEKLNEKAQKLAFDTFASYEYGPQLRGYETPQMHADARQELKDKFAAGEIDAATYQRANSLLDAEASDRNAAAVAAVAQAAEPLQELLREDPRRGLADLQQANPEAVRELMSTSSGQSTLYRMLTDGGKKNANNTYRNIAVAYDIGSLDLIRERIPDPAAVIAITAGMDDAQAKFVRRAYAEAHGITFKEGDRVSLESIVRQKLGGYEWALDKSDPAKPVVNLRLVDAVLGVVNSRGKTRGEQLEALDSMFNDTMWSHGEQPVPRELSGMLPPEIAAEVVGDTRYGQLRVTDIAPDVREHLQQVAKTLYFPDREVSPRIIARRAEELWLRYGRPTSEDDAKRITGSLDPDADARANLDVSIGADFDYVARQVHPDALRLFSQIRSMVRSTGTLPSSKTVPSRSSLMWRDSLFYTAAIEQHGDPQEEGITKQDSETRRFAVNSFIERLRYDVEALLSAKRVEPLEPQADIHDFDGYTDVSNDAATPSRYTQRRR